MKTLAIIRHAKSSWSFQQLDDFSRPLGVRGRKDVIKVGAHIKKEGIPSPDLMITSTASRAFYTTLFLADFWGYPETEIELEPGLYDADADESIEILQSYDDLDYLSITGHNPGFTELIQSLSKQPIHNLPTCGVFIIEFDVDSWELISSNHVINETYIYPKGL
jgi:phosphohistidine phosphatase